MLFDGDKNFRKNVEFAFFRQLYGLFSTSPKDEVFELFLF